MCFNPQEHDVSSFDCGDSDLNDFLKNDAARYQDEHLSHTRLVFHKGGLIAYITLLTDCIVLKTPEKKRALKELRSLHQHLPSFPALKIGRVAVRNDLQHSGIGTELLKYSVALVVRMNRELNIGCR